MTPEQHEKLSVETTIALAALVELLADGEGLASLNEYRARFRELMAPLIEQAVVHP